MAGPHPRMIEARLDDRCPRTVVVLQDGRCLRMAAVELLPTVGVAAEDGRRVAAEAVERMHPPPAEAEATAVEVVAVDATQAVTNS